MDAVLETFRNWEVDRVIVACNAASTGLDQVRVAAAGGEANGYPVGGAAALGIDRVRARRRARDP